jgi:CRP-like cAMP-binding protein
MTDATQARRNSRQFNLELVHRLSAHIDFESKPAMQVPAGRLLIRKGDVVQRLPLLVEGRIDAVVHASGDDGHMVLPASWDDGELAMLSSLFSRDPAPADVVAARDSVCRWLPVDEVEACLMQSREMLVLLVRILTRLLRDSQARARSWVEHGVHERVCGAITRLVAERPRGAKGQVVLDETHERLALRCGVSRPRLSRELKRLEDQGRVRLGRGAIEVLDLRWFDEHRW